MRLTPRALIAWLLASVGLPVLAAGAVEYRLQVTNLDYQTFLAHTERVTAAGRAEELMGRLEAQLDARTFPPGAVLPGRQVHLLEDPGYGGTPPARLHVLPATQQQVWTTLVWEGDPGNRVAFVVKTDMRAWPEVWAVAANPEGVLRRLSLGGTSWCSRQRPEVPEVADTFLANAVRQGTFPRWWAQHAPALNGLSVVVARGLSPFTSQDADRVYAVITPPSEPRTFTLVIGWRTEWRRPGGN